MLYRVVYGNNMYQSSIFLMTDKPIKDLAYFVEDKYGEILRFDEQYNIFYLVEGGSVVFRKQEVLKL
jgi:hypothetical protein